MTSKQNKKTYWCIVAGALLLLVIGGIGWAWTSIMSGLLHSAAEFGSVGTGRVLVLMGADVNADDWYAFSLDPFGGMPLHRAVDYDNLEFAQFLVSKGADVNAKNDFGRTPLHNATTRSRIDFIKLLVTEGANVNEQTPGGETPLHRVAYNSWIDPNINDEIIRFLVSHGADVNAKNNNGKTPLDLAKEKENTVVVKYLSSIDKE